MRVAIALALVIAVAGGADAVCSVCDLHLRARTGSYDVRLAKDPGAPAGTVAMRATVVNHGRRPLVLGAHGTGAVLNAVTPAMRGTSIVRVTPPGRSETLAPGSHRSFGVGYGYRLGKPGVYRFNVSVGNVDSNVVTYVVR